MLSNNGRNVSVKTIDFSKAKKEFSIGTTEPKVNDTNISSENNVNELKENFENKWIPEESKEIDRNIEMIRAKAYEILKKLLPSKNLILNLNSLGTSQNLIDYKDKLKKFFNDNKSKLSQESYEKINSNPLRILDSKQDTDIALSSKAPSINEFLSIETKNHFEELKKTLLSFLLIYLFTTI